jgi:hypothetical protein
MERHLSAACIAAIDAWDGTVASLAERIGVTPQCLSAWKCGGAVAQGFRTKLQVNRLADAVGVSRDAVYAEDAALKTEQLTDALVSMLRFKVDLSFDARLTLAQQAQLVADLEYVALYDAKWAALRAKHAAKLIENKDLRARLEALR